MASGPMEKEVSGGREAQGAGHAGFPNSHTHPVASTKEAVTSPYSFKVPHKTLSRKPVLLLNQKKFETSHLNHAHLTDREKSPWGGNNTCKGTEVVNKRGQTQTPSP